MDLSAFVAAATAAASSCNVSIAATGGRRMTAWLLVLEARLSLDVGFVCVSGLTAGCVPARGKGVAVARVGAG